MNIRSQKGFTLVEIMIVVVIIGLLAAMAIPAFQKVRSSSMEKSMLNDGRQIGAAIQQYCMEYGMTRVDPVPGYNSNTGLLSGNEGFTQYLRQIGKKYTHNFGTMPADGDSFSLTLQGAFPGTSGAAIFNGEGKKTN